MNSNPIFVKYPEIPHLMETLEILDGNNLQIFEKLDGGNAQVRKWNSRVFCGSRTNFLKRKEHFRFDWFKDFNKWAMSNPSFYNLPENLIVYGEFMAHHSLFYKPEFVNKFFLIDVYDLRDGRFIPYQEARQRLEENLEIKDLLFLDPLAEGKLSLSKIKRLAKGKSQYSGSWREGVVIKDYNNQKFAKLWRTSVDPTKEGLIEEIKKAILSLKNKEMLNYRGSKKRLPEFNALSQPAYIESYAKFVKNKKNYDSLLKKGRTLDSDLVLRSNAMPEDVFKYYSEKVYDELRKSGRKNVPLTEIGEMVKKVLDKI